MESKNREKQEPATDNFVSSGKDWKQIAALMIQKRTPKFRWLLFSEKILGKNAYVNKFNLIKKRTRSQKIEQKYLMEREFFQYPEPYSQNNDKKSSIGTKSGQRSRFYFDPGLMNFLIAYINKFNLTDKRTRVQKPEQNHLMEREFPRSPELNTEINKKESSFETKSGQSNYFHIDSGLKDFLAGFLNIRIPPVKIFADKRSDALVRKFNADALTHDDKIFFKTGKFDPGDKRGIALLGHELTHAAKSRMQDQNLQSMTNVSEEQQALINEKKVLHYFSLTEPHNDDDKSPSYKPVVNYLKGQQFDSEAYRRYETPANPNTSGNFTNMNQSFHSQSKSLRAALTSRDLSLPAETSSSFQLSEQQFRSIKDEIYQDIMQRIKIEFERGG